MSERTHPVTQYHIPKDLSSGQHSCENLKTWVLGNTPVGTLYFKSV